MSYTPCPKDDHLAGYANGSLSEDLLDSISQHVDECGRCEKIVSEMEAGNDVMVATLRRGAPGDSFASESRCQQVVDSMVNEANGESDRMKNSVPQVLATALQGVANVEPPSIESSSLNTSSGIAASLISSRLVTQQQIAACQQSGTPPLDDESLLSKLIEQGALTLWQAEQLKSGVVKSFYLGNYKLLNQIGRGGMGHVFEAHDVQLNRRVALKVVGQADARQNERFLHEARAALQLQHSNIVHSFELGQHGSRYFLVMELIEGITLKQYIQQRGQLTMEQTAYIAYEVLCGLDHAHRQGIIHRDIKPSNIMITRDGQIKIADMGLAKVFGPLGAADTEMTRTGAFLGSLDYCPPEQAEDAKRAMPASDIYALGCTLYHCLTGRPPFEGGTEVQKIVAHRQNSPHPIQAFNQGVVDSFSNLILVGMMAKNPQQRYQSATDIGLQFRQWVSGQAIRDEMAALSEAVMLEIYSPAIARPMAATTGTVAQDSQTVFKPQPTPSQSRPDNISLSAGVSAMIAGGIILGVLLAGSLGYMFWKPVAKAEKKPGNNSGGSSGNLQPLGTGGGTPSPFLTPPDITNPPVPQVPIDLERMRKELENVVPPVNLPVPNNVPVPDNIPPPVNNNPPVTAKPDEIPATIAPLPSVDGPVTDILSLIDIDRDRLKGKARMEDGVLLTDEPFALNYAKVAFPIKPPEEYDLIADVTQLGDTNQGISIGVVVQGYQCMCAIDGWGDTTSIGMIDGTRAKSRSYPGKPHKGRLLVPGKKSTIVCSVRKGMIAISFDGVRVFQWSGDPSRLSLYSWYKTKSKDTMFVASWTQSEISRLEIRTGEELGSE